MFVVVYIAVYFIEPPFGAGFGYHVIFASLVPMPKAAVDKNYGFVFGEYDIGLTGHIFYMQAVAETVFMQKLAHQHFGLGILTPNARHVIAARFLTVYICHGTKK